MAKPDREKDIKDAEVVEKDEKGGRWTLTDALVEAFTLGFETASDRSRKTTDADEALDEGEVSERLGRIHEKFGTDAISAVEDLLDLESEE
jgi:hypothetical protein